jgi:hypothetical protein
LVDESFDFLMIGHQNIHQEKHFSALPPPPLIMAGAKTTPTNIIVRKSYRVSWMGQRKYGAEYGI